MARSNKKTTRTRGPGRPRKKPEVKEQSFEQVEVKEEVVVPEPPSERPEVDPYLYLEGMDFEKAQFWTNLSKLFKETAPQQHKAVDKKVTDADFHKALVLFFWRQQLLTTPRALANHLSQVFTRWRRNLPV